MWKKLLKHKLALAFLSGLCLVLAFPPIEIVPLVFFFPIFLNALILLCDRFWKGFWMGFFVSLIVMLGGFYWVAYVIHVFGHMSWALAILLYVGFCGFGALNFPLFVGLGAYLQKRLHLSERPAWFIQCWYMVGLPALFTILEWAIPKLFPWYVSHGLYRAIWLTQIVEFTGCTFLSFAIYSLGSAICLPLIRPLYPNFVLRPKFAAIPIVLWVLCLGFGISRVNSDYAKTEGKQPLTVGLIQANIGSLEKVQARAGSGNRIRYVMDQYIKLTNEVVEGEKPDLLIWPETAMPFYLIGTGSYSREIYRAVQSWNVPLITGGYYPYASAIFRDYNSAYLLDPVADPNIKRDVYHKNILLAFGEYFPFGETFPKLYMWFPQVSNFRRGTEQNAFTLHDGTRIGVTICYEAIVPSFFRKAADNDVQAMVNLTNDSWFGITSEPYQHAALSVFRAIETRTPFFRVTNTGISFTVDMIGRMSKRTGVYEPGTLKQKTWLPKSPSNTIYLRYGDWFVIVCILMLASLIFFDYAPLLIRLSNRRPPS